MVGNLIAAAVAVLLLGGYGYAAFEIGGAVADGKWMKRERGLVSKALEDKQQEMDDLRRFQELREEASASLINEKNKQLEALELKYIAASRKPGGLRVSSKVCESAKGPASDGAGDGVSRSEESGTVRLPMQTEEGLWSVVHDADYVVLKYDQCRDVLRANNLLR